MFLLSLFLSGCVSVDNVKKSNSNSKINTKVENNELPIKDPVIIEKCLTSDCFLDKFEKCSPVQYFWHENKTKKISFLVVFGEVNGKCNVMLNKDDLTNNLQCFLSSDYLTKKTFDQLVNKDFSKKSEIDTICSVVNVIENNKGNDAKVDFKKIK